MRRKVIINPQLFLCLSFSLCLSVSILTHCSRKRSWLEPVWRFITVGFVYNWKKLISKFLYLSLKTCSNAIFISKKIHIQKLLQQFFFRFFFYSVLDMLFKIYDILLHHYCFFYTFFQYFFL